MPTRREFLAGSGMAVLGLSLTGLVPVAARGARGATASGGDREVRPSGPLPAYRSWEDVYRQRWQWDKVVKGTHLRANCISGCSWNLFVKEGIVWREEQNAVYGAANPSIPDFNPRGCQKGACYADLMYSPSRIKYPLKRAGERGAGRWQRITWEQALGEIAEKLVNLIVREGSDAILYDHGTTNQDFGPGTAGEARLFHMIGAIEMDSWAGVGDLPMGAIQTWGMFNVDGSSDDWFRSDLIVVWIANPVYTRIPDVHYMLEARYRGARLVVVAPDYNATAVHADLWVNPRAGTDAALALAVARVIVEERLYDEPYVQEQTDLPFLVRDDTGRFLRENDLHEGGADDVFYVWDLARGELVEAPATQGRPRGSLALGALRPALAGRFQARLARGGTVSVRPVFARLAERLAPYTPEAVAKTTGVGAGVIRRLARDFARSPAALVLASWGACKHYHSDLVQRAIILLVALTGNQGRPGGGLRLGAWYTVEGFEELGGEFHLAYWKRLAMKIFKPALWEYEEGIVKATRDRRVMPLMPWLYHHAGMRAVVSPATYNDPALSRPFDAYVREAEAKGWMPVYPSPDKAPKAYIFSGPNPLRRWPTPQLALRHLWPKLELIVNLNFRMSTTGAYADYLLPAAGYYEKKGLKYPQSLVPYIISGTAAVPPLHEAKGEWEISSLLARAIATAARARGVDTFTTASGRQRTLARLPEEFSLQGALPPDNEDKVMDHIVANSPIIGLGSWRELEERGAVPIKTTGMYTPTNAICSDLVPGEPVTPSRWFAVEKRPWPTLTGRQQFYIDHPWYLDLGEELPVYKEPPAPGGDYPLRLSGGHTRWSIHAIWRDHHQMLRLERGEPVIYLNPADAAPRGIRDHDRVRVRNDVGAFLVRAKLSPAVQPGEAIIYHAWEPYQFPRWHGPQEPVASPWKPLHLVGDYGQLHYRMFYAAPSHSPRGTTVDVERA